MDWQSDRAAVMSGIKDLKQEGGYTSAKAGCPLSLFSSWGCHKGASDDQKIS